MQLFVPVIHAVTVTGPSVVSDNVVEAIAMPLSSFAVTSVLLKEQSLPPQIPLVVENVIEVPGAGLPVESVTITLRGSARSVQAVSGVLRLFVGFLHSIQ